ncbi:MAG: hypothetical protein R1F52_00470 [Candidatus Nitrosoabyssus spongiisocia]|nr:MAG: hypothetical protein R1F52_00470 [Nitrosopumilaceae archaeon AB1(1)]
MPNLFIDIETIPDIKPELYLDSQRRVESGELTRNSEEKELYWLSQRGALNPLEGKVMLITYQINDAHIFRLKEWESDEKTILRKFFDILSDLSYGSSKDRLHIIGHNILSFDIFFLYNRMIKKEIFEKKFIYQRLISRPMFIDFLQMHLPLNNFTSRGLKHDVLAHAYQLPTKETQGSGAITDYFEGNFDKILEYSKKEFVYPQMYKKITENGLISKEKLQESINWYNDTHQIK